MLTVRMECRKISVEELAIILTQSVESNFRVWLYKKKTYATFRLISISTLRNLIEEFRSLKLKVQFLSNIGGSTK